MLRLASLLRRLETPISIWRPKCTYRGGRLRFTYQHKWNTLMKTVSVIHMKTETSLSQRKFEMHLSWRKTCELKCNTLMKAKWSLNHSKTTMILSHRKAKMHLLKQRMIYTYLIERLRFTYQYKWSSLIRLKRAYNIEKLRCTYLTGRLRYIYLTWRLRFNYLTRRLMLILQEDRDTL